MSALRDAFRELTRYPSAITGLVIIASLIALAIYTVIAIPYSEGIRLWRGGEDIWVENPRNARPSWVNFFLKERLPKTMIVSTQQGAEKAVRSLPGDLRGVEISLPFDYSYDAFPSEINLFLKANFKERRPYVSLFWVTPDGRRISLGERSVRSSERYSISLDRQLSQRLGRRPPEIALFAPPDAAIENAVHVKKPGADNKSGIRTADQEEKPDQRKSRDQDCPEVWGD